MAYRTPSGTNVFSISWESTGAIVSATRNPDQFKLARYIQYVPVKERVFRYLKLDLDEPARVPTSGEFAWAPGQDAPVQNNIGAFQFVDNSTTKYAYAWVLPDEAIDQAEWNLEGSQMGIVQAKAMTNRTILTSTLVQTPGNWPSTNTADVNTLNGGSGRWNTASSDPASAYYLAFKKSIVKGCTIIVQQTNAVIKWRDCNLVLSPTCANTLGNTSEVMDFVKGSPDAFARQKGEDSQVGEYGMPAKYYVDLVVEDAVKVTSRVNITTGYATSGTRAWVWADALPALMARQGDVVAQYGGSAMATVQLYAYREMEVYTKSDPDNERQMGRVVDDISLVLPFGQSGFLFQNAVS